MRLEWSDEAYADLDRQFAYYADIDPDLPARMHGRINAAIDRLLDFPLIGAPIGSTGWHRWLVRKTPFLIFYGVEGDTIVVRRVVDARSNWSSIVE